jgi:hypothetical protein
MLSVPAQIFPQVGRQVEPVQLLEIAEPPGSEVRRFIGKIIDQTVVCGDAFHLVKKDGKLDEPPVPLKEAMIRIIVQETDKRLQQAAVAAQHQQPLLLQVGRSGD